MPIYKHEEMDGVIARIREKVRRGQVPLGPAVPEETVRAFEKAHGVTLPEGYRRYLLEIGNGFEWEDYGFSSLSFPPEEGTKTSRLALPFPFAEAWIWEAEEAPPDGTDMQMVLDGNLELIDIGCCQTYNLIMTGPCRGEVWAFADAGIQPCCQRQDFLGWFEKWLDQGDRVDYFEEYS